MTTYGPWRKSTRSPNNSNCVEVAGSATTVALRDSKLPTTDDFPMLTTDLANWRGLLADIRASKLDC